MAKVTLSDLIASQILEGEEDEESVQDDAVVKTASVNQPPSPAPDDIEKLAHALEFVGRRGVDSFLVKEATPASDPPPGTDDGPAKANTVKKQVGPHKGAPPMAEPGFGSMPNNDGKKPGLPAPATGVDTSGKQTGDHHPGLKSSEAAIAVKKSDKAKLVAPSLDAVLDTKAYADPKVQESLSHAASAGEKNFRKTAGVQHDPEEVNAELARRVATANEARD
ncbi:MAG: hypothetical protein ACYSWP_13205 [Planctomycetota bacterium]|jgi:hypothetical protein